VRIGDALVTISNDDLKVNVINDPDTQLADLYIGTLPQDDNVNVQEDSGATQLDVLANDRPGDNGQPPSIVEVTQPLRQQRYFGYISYGIDNNEPAGTVTISADGRSLVFMPAKDFFGVATFTYIVFDPVHGRETATVTINVESVPDDPVAVDDEFSVPAGATAVQLSVLANDVNVDSNGSGSLYNPYINLNRTQFTDDSITAIDYALPQTTTKFASTTNGLTDLVAINDYYWPPPLAVFNGLKITAVGTPDHGGSIEIVAGMYLSYTPAADFEGIETFTYTVETFASAPFPTNH
jgi:hypothetical protein